MNKWPVIIKMLTNSLMALAVLTVGSLAAFAAPDAVITPEPVMGDKDGVLVANGNVTVNGNAAKTGMTVLSESTVATGDNSIAMIESPVFGRVTLGPGTTAKLIYSGNNLRIESTCNDMRVACKEGQCTVSDKNKVLKVLTTGQDDHFDSTVDVTSSAWIDVVINCGRDVVCPPPFAPAIVSSSLPALWVLLGGVITGTTIVAVTRPKDSPTQP
jgi:hypothetical protein